MLALVTATLHVPASPHGFGIQACLAAHLRLTGSLIRTAMIRTVTTPKYHQAQTVSPHVQRAVVRHHVRKLAKPRACGSLWMSQRQHQRSLKMSYQKSTWTRRVRKSTTLLRPSQLPICLMAPLFLAAQTWSTVPMQVKPNWWMFLA